MKRTQALLLVAAALLSRPTGRHWGYDLSKQTGLRSGILYPILQRMFDEGWLSDGWEEASSSGRRKRPPRRYYKITELGLRELGALPLPVEAARSSSPARGSRLTTLPGAVPNG
jgi:PadR family transcriptional regulator PadR